VHHVGSFVWLSKDVHYMQLKNELRLNNTQKQETLCRKYEKLHKRCNRWYCV